ncbi:MAG: CapA family protein [Candidatus Limnocylindrales bacterium]
MKVPALTGPRKADGASGGTSRTAVGGALLLAGGVVAVIAVISSGVLISRVHGAPPSNIEVAAATPSLSAAPAVAQSPAANPAPSQTATPVTASLEPIVPVVSFWSAPFSIRLVEVARLWAGLADAVSDTEFSSIVVADGVADPLAKAFRIPPAAGIRVLSAAQVKAAVRASPSTLGLLAVDDVTPDVRALSVDGVALFGSDRLRDVARWPLMVASTAPPAFSTASEWTLAAGGDVNLDRAVYVKAVSLGYGPDFPWSGGYAEVAHYECCGWQGASLAVARDTGGAGALRAKFEQADIALVNLEGSAPDDFAYRANSLVFTFDPALLAGLRDAGIDAVSLANNHIRNGGDQGVLDTCKNLDAIGIAHAGAGADTTAARRPAWLNAAGLRVAVLAYSAVGSDNWAAGDHPGAAPLDPASITADIKAARTAGADIVIVMPHWGQEYSYALSSDQKNEAAAFIAAGADLVLGSHSHWVGAIQSVDGPDGPAFVDYSMGDLLFDLNHDVQAQEGVILTLTFSGRRLVQVAMDPTVMIDGAQVALMSPAGDGRAVIVAIHAASRQLIDW